jgi:hypothetical protein
MHSQARQRGPSPLTGTTAVRIIKQITNQNPRVFGEAVRYELLTDDRLRAGLAVVSPVTVVRPKLISNSRCKSHDFY